MIATKLVLLPCAAVLGYVVNQYPVVMSWNQSVGSQALNLTAFAVGFNVERSIGQHNYELDFSVFPNSDKSVGFEATYVGNSSQYANVDDSIPANSSFVYIRPIGAAHDDDDNITYPVEFTDNSSYILSIELITSADAITDWVAKLQVTKYDLTLNMNVTNVLDLGHLAYTQPVITNQLSDYLIGKFSIKSYSWDIDASCPNYRPCLSPFEMELINMEVRNRTTRLLSDEEHHQHHGPLDKSKIRLYPIDATIELADFIDKCGHEDGSIQFIGKSALISLGPGHKRLPKRLNFRHL